MCCAVRSRLIHECASSMRFPCMALYHFQVRRPAERKRLKRAGEGRQANDAEEMKAELFGDGVLHWVDPALVALIDVWSGAILICPLRIL